MYNVHMNGSKIAETEANQHIVTGVEQGKEHEFAVDKAGSGRQTVKIFVPYPEQRVLNKRVTKKLFDGAEIAWDTLLPIGEGRTVDGYYVYKGIDDTNPVFVTETTCVIRGIDVNYPTFDFCVEALYSDGARSKKEFVNAVKYSPSDLLFRANALTYRSFSAHYGDSFPLVGDTIVTEVNGQTQTATTPGQYSLFTPLMPSTYYDVKVTYNVNVANNGPSFTKMFEVVTKEHIIPAVTVTIDQVTFNGAKFSWTPPAGFANIKHYVILIDDVEVAKVSGARSYEYTGHTPNTPFVLTIYFDTLEGYRSNSYSQSVTTLPLSDLAFVVDPADLTSWTAQVKVNRGPFTNDIVSVVLDGGTSDNMIPEEPFVNFINLTPQTEYTLTGFYVRNFGLSTEERYTIPTLKFTTQ